MKKNKACARQARNGKGNSIKGANNGALGTRSNSEEEVCCIMMRIKHNGMVGLFLVSVALFAGAQELPAPGTIDRSRGIVPNEFPADIIQTQAGLEAIVAGAVEKVASRMQFIEGPVWHKDGFLLFSDIPAKRIMKWIAPDQTEVFRSASGASNGLTFDREGRLLACEHDNRRVSRTLADGTIETLADQFEGKKLNSPNDCCARSDGTVFFTDPTYGLGSRRAELNFRGAFAVKPNGEVIALARDFTQPNGVALSPDEKTLYVADTEKDHVRAFPLADDGTVSVGTILARMDNPDGMKVDVDGRLYVTAATGVVVIDPEGKTLGTIRCPEQPANCGFGGSENKTLFITARTSLYRVELKVAGTAVWPVQTAVE